MKVLSAVCVIGMLVAGVDAAPLRVAMVDFEDQAGMEADSRLGGAIVPGALADKGALLLGKRLAADSSFALIDRRDFISQLEAQALVDAGSVISAGHSALHAAQALRADALIRGSILSFSTGTRVVNQGGHHSEHSRITLRVGLEAQSAVDGEVIAISDGSAQIEVRQTPEVQTSLGEDEVLGLLEQAIDECLTEVAPLVVAWRAAAEERPRIRLSVKTDADPALVEIDGILVGTTPLENHTVFAGDHILKVGKPGYYDLSKRILFEQDTAIEVPMLKIELSADEEAEVLKSIRLHVFQGEPGMVIHALD